MKRPHPRRGFSLVEMLTTMMIGSVVIGLVLTTIHLMLGSQQQGEGRARQQLGISRLNTQFRRDVAGAEEVQRETQENEVAGLTMTQGERTIRWTGVSNGLLRESTSPGSNSVRDLYWLGTGVKSDWSWDPQRRLAEISIQLPRRFISDSTSERSLQEEIRDSLSIVAVAESLDQAEKEGE